MHFIYGEFNLQSRSLNIDINRSQPSELDGYSFSYRLYVGVIVLSHNLISNSLACVIFIDQFTALNEELSRRREECIQLKSLLASRTKDSIETAKESYGGNAEILNEVLIYFAQY